MFRNYPSPTKVSINSSGHEIGHAKFAVEFDQDSDTPECIRDFLRSHGWSNYGSHPDTREDLWQSKEDHTEYGYYKWEQAVAMQMFIFMNIGPKA